MSDQGFDELRAAAQAILDCAIVGPVEEEGRHPNMASWLGCGTREWSIVKFFKDYTDDQAWFCMVDREHQQTFLLIVAAELFCTT